MLNTLVMGDTGIMKHPVKDKCTVNKQGRTIQDRPFQSIADEVDKRWFLGAKSDRHNGIG